MIFLKLALRILRLATRQWPAQMFGGSEPMSCRRGQLARGLNINSNSFRNITSFQRPFGAFLLCRTNVSFLAGGVETTVFNPEH